MLAISALAALPAGAQRLSFYETRSILLPPEQVTELADRPYWATRLATQSHLTLIHGTESALPVPVPEALLAAISTWLPDAPAEPSNWVFALPDRSGGVTSLGAHAVLRPGVQRPELHVHPLEVDHVVALDAPEVESSQWRPAHSYLHADFPNGIAPYCDAHSSVCASVFGWIDKVAARQLRALVTVSHNGAPTTFYVRRPGADAVNAGPLVQYLGEVGVTHLSPPPGFGLKDGADLELEQMTSSDSANLGQLRGVAALPLRERVAVKSAILNYYQTGTRSAEVDVVLPAGPAGEAMLYTLRFLPESNDVAVDALGPAANLLLATGPRSDVRRIPGFPAQGDGAALRDWLHRRYPALSAKGATPDEIVASTDRLIEKNSEVPEWFAANYGIAVLGPIAADRRLAEAHGRPPELREGLIRFNAPELRTLETVLQTLGEPALTLLRGTALVRQGTATAASPFGGRTSRVQIAGHTFTRSRAAPESSQRPDVTATVVIYDTAHSPARFIGGRAPDGVLRAYPPEAATFAHEFGHVISGHAPAQRRFKELVTSLDVAPFTLYAASNPDSEFFPEALALYLLNPAWVHDNHPELYARVQAYARRPRSDALKGQPQEEVETRAR